MSIQTYNTSIINKNHELKTEKQILTEYYNSLVRECRKETQNKTYDELEQGESYSRYETRLGYFEERLNDTISEMNKEITYCKHKQELNKLYNENCLYAWEYTENPLNDLNTYAKILRNKLQKVIKIYEQHTFRKTNLIRGYKQYLKNHRHNGRKMGIRS